MALRKLVAGNWKMNGLAAVGGHAGRARRATPPGCDVLICPPATLLARLAGGRFPIGGQDCHPERRRRPHRRHLRRDARRRRRHRGHRRPLRAPRRPWRDRRPRRRQGRRRLARRPPRHRLRRRDRGRARRRETLARIGDQLAGSIPDGATADRLAVAYEPVWAIGTGRTPTLPEIAEVHGFIRETLARRFGPDTAAGIRLLYGGSVKPANAAAIFAVAERRRRPRRRRLADRARLRRHHRRRRLSAASLLMLGTFAAITRATGRLAQR